MKRFNGRKLLAAGSVLAVLFALHGCGDMRQSLSGEDSINYKSVVRADPLSIPPDLTQASSDPRYRAPAVGSTSFSQYQQGQATASKGAAVPAAQAGVLPTRADMRIERDGDLRWLVIDMPAEQVFPKVSDFWTESGFVLDVVDPKAGLLVTNWAENRANIPESWLRQALGSVLEGMWDTGTRDKFRTRMERSGGNRTAIYVTHQHMVEEGVLTSTETNVRWKNGKEDPGLNSAMIARLMVFLGEDVDGARKKLAQAQVSPQQPKVALPSTDKTTLLISDSFERAWRRVGVALDSGGFAVDDRDRAAGDFFVRYVDTDTGAKREDPGFFSRLFGAKDTPSAKQYRIHLTHQGDQTMVTILDANGHRDTSPTAQRILDVLSGKL